MSTQNDIILQNLQRKHNLALIFISHDLSIVHHISDKIAVLYLGKVIEFADKTSLYNEPKHPYTKALLSAAPIPDPELAKNRKRTILAGELPSPINPPSGCSFRTRCPIADESCAMTSPELKEVTVNHKVSCLKV